MEKLEVQGFTTFKFLPFDKLTFVYHKNPSNNPNKLSAYKLNREYTGLMLNPKDLKALYAMMKTNKTDVLTFGRDFYTLCNDEITKIDHEDIRKLVESQYKYDYSIGEYVPKTPEEKFVPAHWDRKGYWVEDFQG